MTTIKKDLPIVDKALNTYTPSDEVKKERAEKLHPLTQDLEEYKNTLGDGTKEFRGLPSGYNEIDELIGGLDRFILLAGRSGAGKTTLALQLGLGVAEHTPVIIYSFEMSRNEIITKLLQTTAKRLGLTGLYTNTIELQGNKADLADDLRQAIHDGLQSLDRTGERLFIKDSSNGIPRILPYKGDKSPTLFDDIEQVKKQCKTESVLVIIDSVQDIVRTDNPNQVQAEVEAISQLTTLQQKTGATILVTAQKNKGSVNSDDSYADVMGSMSFIHKPNTVIELITPKEMFKKCGKDEKDRLQELADEIERESKHGGGKPMFINVIKGRFTGVATLPLTYYGAYGYFKIAKDPNFNELFKQYKN